MLETLVRHQYLVFAFWLVVGLILGFTHRQRSSHMRQPLATFPTLAKIREQWGFAETTLNAWVEYVRLNPKDLPAAGKILAPSMDIETGDLWVKEGHRKVYGYLWGSTVILDPDTPKGQVLLVTQRDQHIIHELPVMSPMAYAHMELV